MPEVRFYHLQRQSLEEALPKLVEKVCDAGLRTAIKVPNSDTMASLDAALWEFSPSSFIPHGVAGGNFEDKHPVYITEGDDNPSAATVQLLVNAVSSEQTEAFDKCLYMFDGRDEKIVAAARQAWKRMSEWDWEMSYWQQRETGGWEQKA